MKKLIILTTILCLVCFSATAQSKTNATAKTSGQKVKAMSQGQKDTLLFAYLDAYLSQLREPQYELYPTENMWTFLKLNTMTGQIWQVQYGVGDTQAMETFLDTNVRLSKDDEPICGRFKLYKTQNMYNFILLDTISGKVWQVQWSIDMYKRLVVPIN